ncbi:MAG: hypothetical protein Q7R41_09620 [Phycisphaerales bacterium]|nr:hypothetical protein [Phycisphaerales bacterium]
MVHLTNDMIRRAVLAQNSGFDTHDVIGWLIANEGRAFILQLYHYNRGQVSFFDQCHMQIGQSIATLKDLVVRNGDVESRNILGNLDTVARWERLP